MRESLNTHADDLLTVRGLQTTLTTARGAVRVLDDVRFSVPRGATVGIAGESGSGKTMLSKSIMNLLPKGGHIDFDQLRFDGADLNPRRPPDRHFWGGEISMVFQDPMTALNPVRTIGAQICDPLRVHLGLDRAKSQRRAIELLHDVGIPAPATRLAQYPHEMSGGMRQRVMIAIAISCEPKLLIADEPTTGLDVTVQRQILMLLRRLKDERGMSMMIVSHDIALLSDVVDQVNVMYAGTIVETMTVEQLRARDVHHRYTEALLRAHPDVNAPPRTRLASIPGTPPSLLEQSNGCKFATRCSFASDICRSQTPKLTGDPTTITAFACHCPRTPTTVTLDLQGELV